MRRVQSDPSFNKPEVAKVPRPLSRRHVVASMIDLAMPRISVAKDAVAKVVGDAPQGEETLKTIRANLEK
jgi:hypothetical protein